MVDIFQQVFGTLRNAVNLFANSDIGKALLNNREVKVSASYQQETTTFPHITIEEKTNAYANSELDSREKFSSLMYEINIYDNSINKIAITRKLAQICNDALTNLGFKRIFNEPLPNIADATIYRIIQRFDGYIDNETGKVYKRLIM